MIDYETIKAGDILVSSPNSNKGLIFNKSVILMLSNDKNGSSGVIINKLLNILEGNEINESLLINKSKIIKDPTKLDDKTTLSVFFGGPVEQEKGIIIHSDDYLSGNTMKITSGASISTNSKIINDIALNKGPLYKMLVLGYASWGEGQLNNELKRDDWILVSNKFSPLELSPIFRLLFVEDPAYRWQFALSLANIKISNYVNSCANA